MPTVAAPPQPPFLHHKIAVVDLETTGTAATADGITEIGIVLIENGEVIEEWSQLVNPGMRIPPEIQALTGISDAMVADAPRFGEVADAVYAKLEGALFVAHNARFDYGFLKNAFRRAGRTLVSDVLCTVRLSRKLYPQYAKHSLDDLVQRHGLHAEGRHRALGDARLAWQFLQHVASTCDAEEVASATRALLKMPSLPPQLDVGAFDALPDGPGVYLFYGVNDLPIYIGKSVNLRDRVRSHFSSDHRNSNDVRLSMEIRRFDFEETAGEFGALLRESQLIKQVKPLRNLRLRRNAQMVMVLLAAADGPAQIIPLDEADLNQADSLFGPFATRSRAKAVLNQVSAEHRLCWKALGTQATDGACFAYQLKRCEGFCVGKESMTDHNARLAIALEAHAFPPWPYEGAIAVVETHPDHGWQRAHVFRDWRYLGTAVDESELDAIAESRGEIEFDADVYKLLRKVLSSQELPVKAVSA